jgi:hypothetical protein
LADSKFCILLALQTMVFLSGFGDGFRLAGRAR